MVGTRRAAQRLEAVRRLHTSGQTNSSLDDRRHEPPEHGRTYAVHVVSEPLQLRPLLLARRSKDALIESCEKSGCKIVTWPLAARSSSPLAQSHDVGAQQTIIPSVHPRLEVTRFMKRRDPRVTQIPLNFAQSRTDGLIERGTACVCVTQSLENW